MNITNPTNFGIPGLTMTTSNVEGTGNAIRTGASIALYDATVATNVAASASAGDTATAARRNHVHGGIAGAGTVVDEAITRFNGTGGAAIQGYSSLPPTISDAGIISLTSGALKFPVSEITSADANTMDDWQSGTWTPVLRFANSATGIAYGTQTGSYVKVGQLVSYFFNIILTDKGSASGAAQIYGLPFTSADRRQFAGVIAYSINISFADRLCLQVTQDNVRLDIFEMSAAGALSNILDSDFADDSEINGSGWYLTV